MTPLDELLQLIDPSRTIDRVALLAQGALEDFSVKSNVVEDYKEFQSILASLHCHIHNAIFELRPPRRVNYQIDLSDCLRLLKQVYGKNPHRTTFQLARTGNENGLYGIFHQTAKLMAQYYAQQQIAARVRRFLGSQNYDRHHAILDEYLNKFGYLFPGEITESNCANLMQHLERLLCDHPFLVRRMRKSTR